MSSFIALIVLAFLASLLFAIAKFTSNDDIAYDSLDPDSYEREDRWI